MRILFLYAKASPGSKSSGSIDLMIPRLYFVFRKNIRSSFQKNIFRWIVASPKLGMHVVANYLRDATALAGGMFRRTPA